MSTSTPPPVQSDVPLPELLQNSRESPPAGEERAPRMPLALPSSVLPQHARCWMRLMRGTSQPTRQAFEKVQAGLPVFRRKFRVMLLWNAWKV